MTQLHGRAREILKNIVDCYGVGSTPEKFCRNVSDFMEEGRQLLYDPDAHQPPTSPADFRAWRKRLGLSQVAAAAALGISESSVANYESGFRREDRRPVVIPKVVALACAAIGAGMPAEGDR
jgi:DNA-binding XRE family transcriptional regulator